MVLELFASHSKVYKKLQGIIFEPGNVEKVDEGSKSDRDESTTFTSTQNIMSARSFRNKFISPTSSRAPPNLNKASETTIPTVMSRRKARNTYRATHTIDRFRYRESKTSK